MNVLAQVVGNSAKPSSFLVVVVVLGIPQLLCPDTLRAQPALKEVVNSITDEPQASGEETLHKPTDEFNREVPRTSVQGFLTAARERQYAKAANYLDLRNLSPSLTNVSGEQLAHQLKTVLNRTLWIDLDQLSTDPRGNMEDGLPKHRDRVGHIETKDKAFDILLQRVPRKNGVFIWKFSNATVAQIPELYAQFGYGPLSKVLPEWFFELEFLDTSVWHWIVILALGIPTYFAAWCITWLVAWFLHRRGTETFQKLVQFIAGPIRFLIWIILWRKIGMLLGTTALFQVVAQAGTLLLVGIAWTLFSFLDFLVDRATVYFQKKGQVGAKVFLPPLAAAFKVIIIISTLLMWFDNIGFKVTTLLAGLGVGGLAVALAAQKPLENMFGAITLFMSQPVKIGDFCRFGDRVGTVEEIGLRSTLIRTLDNTLVSVPNAEFSNMQLENYNKRTKIWFHPRIRLRQETTPDQVRYILIEIRKVLYAHPKVLTDPARVRFTGIGIDALELEVFAYIGVTQGDQFLEVAEDLNLRIMEIVQQAGTSFALPSQSIYFEKAKGVNQKLGEIAESHVQDWRTQNSLYLPNFPLEKIAELQGTLDYPPQGSPVK